MTPQTRAVLRALLHEPTRHRYGLELCQETGLPSGTLYPIVARLEGLGWLEGDWEAPETHVAEGRPRRRYYRLTDQGAQQARRALSRGRSRTGRTVMPRPGGARP
jgi:PadR family transcriptional regulator, regulatory protein PadR